MNGLLNIPQTPMAPPARTPVMAPPAQPGSATDMPQAPAPSAEAPSQADVEMFVANALKIIHNPKVSDRLISQVADAKNPVVAVADATTTVIDRLEQSAKAAGKSLSFMTVAQGGNYVMGDIIASAEAAGMKKMSDTDKYKAFSLALGKYLDGAVKSGRMTKEDIIGLGKEAEASPMGQQMMAALGGENGGIA